MKIITQEHAKQLLLASSGRYFSARFVKRTDGSMRKLTGRFGVKQGVTGAGKPFDPANYDLLTVSETVQERDASTGKLQTVAVQFRHIPVDSLREIKVGGEVYQVV